MKTNAKISFTDSLALIDGYLLDGSLSAQVYTTLGGIYPTYPVDCAVIEPYVDVNVPTCEHERIHFKAGTTTHSCINTVPAIRALRGRLAHIDGTTVGKAWALLR